MMPGNVTGDVYVRDIIGNFYAAIKRNHIEHEWNFTMNAKVNPRNNGWHAHDSESVFVLSGFSLGRVISRLRVSLMMQNVT